MADLLLWCKRCWAGYASAGEIPVVCPCCKQETRWTTSAPHLAPTEPFKLTGNDRRFLQSISIAGEDTN